MSGKHGDTDLRSGSRRIHDDRKPDNRKPDNRKPDNRKPDNRKPDNRKPDNRKPDNRKPDNRKSDEQRFSQKPDNRPDGHNTNNVYGTNFDKIRSTKSKRNVLDDTDVSKLRDALPWVEKYRPKNIDSISLDSNIKIQIKKMIEDKDIRNIILEGPSGVGKTSTVRCIAREIFGKYYSSKVLEINASDDRGIKIQNPIDVFNRAYIHIADEDISKVPDFKLVILDEADNMTDKAKHNITKFIETNSRSVRFAFTCNSKDNISTAIQSRCHIINYPKLEKSFIMKRLKEICIMENIYPQPKEPKDVHAKNMRSQIDAGIFAIAEIADGDLRIAVNTLQLTYDRFGTIDKSNVYGSYDKPHPEQSREIIDSTIKQDISKANMLITNMMQKGFSVTDITAGLSLALRQSICSDIPIDIKIKLLTKISYAQYNVSQGLELSSIQARGCIADMCDAMRS